MDPRFQRNHGVISPETMEKLSRTHVLIAGVGGSGGQTAVDLARLGVGYLTLADFDVYERHNINRQVGAFESTVGQSKVKVVSGLCRDVNPAVKVREVHDGITEANYKELVSGLAAQRDKGEADHVFVIETIDIVGVAAKKWLHRECRDRGIVLLTGLMTGFGGTMHVFQPDAPYYEELYVMADGRMDLSKLAPRLGDYMLPEVLATCFAGKGHAPTCVIGATTAAGMMVSEIMRGVIRGEKSMVSWPEYLYVDFFNHEYVRETLPKHPAT